MVTIAKLRFADGVWQGLVHSDEKPALHLYLGAKDLGPLELSADGQGEKTWTLAIAVPAEAIGDGANVLSVCAPPDLQPLVMIPVVCGEMQRGDMVAEVALLRAELDILKRSLRSLARGG
jgi:hypothetical protein